jgi:CRP-like cAMP-binding protein
MILASLARKNELLAALPGDILDGLLPHLQTLTLPLGAVVISRDDRIDHVVFPITAMVALLYTTPAGEVTENAVIGREGVVGVTVLMSGVSSTRSAVVQSAGLALRLPAQVLVAAFAASAPVRHLFGCYIQALMTQILQTAACNRYHSIDQQLCRWLLLSLDRVPGSELAMTHERMASMLGVRREGVSEAAMKLHRAGAIRYVRGHITVLDRDDLERRACECYDVVRREYARLLPHPAQPAAAPVAYRHGAGSVSTLPAG